MNAGAWELVRKFNMAGRNVSYVKQKTPSFIQKFKEKVGYKEGPDVTTKQSNELPDSLDDNEHEDEKPTVVLARNVSEAEASKFLEGLEEERREKEEAEEKSSAEGGKLLFKKPTKRKSDGVVNDTGSKKKDCKKPKARSSMKEVKNRTLLSFGDEEEL